MHAVTRSDYPELSHQPRAADAATSEGLRAQLMGQPHPLAWCKDGSKPGNGLMDPPSRPVGGGVDDSRDSAQPSGQGGPGRSWYTSLGHFPETYSDPLFRQHLTGGIQWVLESDSLRRRSNNSSSPGQPVTDSSSDEPGSGSSLPEIDTTTPTSSSSAADHLVNSVPLRLAAFLTSLVAGSLLC
ncbi:hypothetical protein OC846_005812 [Tilletia horrida]|uniref:ThuA-like domain-containing protein n=1 Tax=Tilletia horrida TaxID=155126 RepID=A0AAN6JPV9_9BASI|nr:hypothetical protein OC846_005812 [Tilletia horrida]